MQQLKTWCEISKGVLIEISPDTLLSFESLEVFKDTQIELLENELSWKLPETYKLFLKSIGKSNLFISDYGTGAEFLGLDEIINASEILVWESWEDEKENYSHRFCIIGAETGLGDYFGFARDIKSEKNFDVFCHEEPPFEYIATSNELKSWKSFDKWIIQLVTSFGDQRL